MGMANVVRLGGPLAAALLGAGAWSSCVDMAGSRTDVAITGDDAAPTGDDGGAPSGSGSSSSGSSGSSSSGGTPTTPDLCGFPSTDAASPVLYSGAPVGPNCVTGIPTPRNGTWFPYHDASGDGGLVVVDVATPGGCGGVSTCALHAYGPVPDAGGFLSYAGVGFDLFDVSGAPTSYGVFANHYTGIQFWAKGTLTGTRGTGYSSSPQTIHLKLITATYRSGDDYGVYCPMTDPTTWTLCRLDFAAAKRDGFNTTLPVAMDTFDGNQLQKIQFEASTYNGPPPAAATFDVWIDEVSFY
jgi:hypothetical protein